MIINKMYALNKTMSGYTVNKQQLYTLQHDVSINC